MVTAPAPLVVIGRIGRVARVVHGKEELAGDGPVDDPAHLIFAGRQGFALVVHSVPALGVAAFFAILLCYEDAPDEVFVVEELERDLPVLRQFVIERKRSRFFHRHPGFHEVPRHVPAFGEQQFSPHRRVLVHKAGTRHEVVRPGCATACFESVCGAPVELHGRGDHLSAAQRALCADRLPRDPVFKGVAAPIGRFCVSALKLARGDDAVRRPLRFREAVAHAHLHLQTRLGPVGEMPEREVPDVIPGVYLGILAAVVEGGLLDGVGL